MVANELQHVDANGIQKIQSEIFDKDHELPSKEKEFILQHILVKRYNDIPSKDLNKLKDIVRLHIPSNLRVKLWMLLTGGADVITHTTDVYKEACERLFQDGVKPGEYDEYDDEREMVTYYLTEDGIKSVHKVLIAMKDLRPDITYCPLLEPLIAVLLHFMDENQCYACICGLFEKKTSFLEETKSKNALTDLSLQDLFKSVNKKGYSRLKSFVMKGSEDDDDDDVYDPSKFVMFPLWRNMIFGKLDFPIVVRIVDCLLVEGAKILYRIGLHLLNLFHSYSLQFQNMQFSDTQDLIATIAQYTQSLDDLAAQSNIKSALKIKFTSKQIAKINHDNSKLYAEQLKEYTDSDAFNKFTKQVIPVNLNQVSDIIKPVLWLQICEWLPARMQLKQPFVLFSTNKDGFNIKTLYNHCEDEEQSLFVLTTQNGETLGTYLSAPLAERTNGHQNLSYFGTGETFIFRLAPKSICYLWNKKAAVGCQHGHKSKYVFVEPTPILLDGKRRSSRRGNARKSLMRRLSRRLSGNFKRSQSTPNARADGVRELTPLERLSAIHQKALDASNGSTLFEPSLIREHSNERSDIDPPMSLKERTMTRNRSLPDYAAVDSSDSHEKTVKFSISSKGLPDDASHIQSSHLETKEAYDVVHKHVEFKSITDTKNTSIDGEESELHSGVGSDGDDDIFHDDTFVGEPPMSLFISCDNSTFTVGGGGGEGLHFDGDIQIGRSSRCETYRNDSLVFTENGDFVIARLDVFGFK